MTVTKFAGILDCAPSYLSSVKSKTRRPGRKLARQIERATNGDVKADHLLNEIKYAKG